MMSVVCPAISNLDRLVALRSCLRSIIEILIDAEEVDVHIILVSIKRQEAANAARSFSGQIGSRNYIYLARACSLSEGVPDEGGGVSQVV